MLRAAQRAVKAIEMHIGIPREIKPLEGRVALIPAACAELTRQGHHVSIERNAGLLSGYQDEDYAAVGVHLRADARELYDNTELIVKVKEPVDPEIDYLRADHVLFSYLHLAANRELAERLLDIGLTAVAFETVEDGFRLPLLAPMSEIAGRLSVQVGTHLLHQPQGGRGVMLGGLPATERGNVVVLGAGVAGGAAATMAASSGANVTVFDKKRERLEAMRKLGANVTGLYAFQHDIEEAVSHADLVVGAVLIPGRHAPCIISREVIRSMNPGSVVADISVDQGGCIETTRPTTYQNPTYVEEAVVHFTVTNMPGAVPRTASQALSASLLPYVLRMMATDWQVADGDLRPGVNIRSGEYVNPAILEELGSPG